VLVGFYSHLLVAVSVGDPAVEDGGSVFLPLRLGPVGSDGGTDDPLGRCAGRPAYRLVGPDRSGQLRFGPALGRLVPPDTGRFDLVGFAAEETGAGLDGAGVSRSWRRGGGRGWSG
jgi:hypothetical protein